MKPLAGVRVVELGTLIAGPFCSRILGEFGAEVIKIEAPGEGDPLRKWRKLYPDAERVPRFGGCCRRATRSR